MKRIIEIILYLSLLNGLIFGGEIFSPGNASFSGVVKNISDNPIVYCRVYAYDSLGNVAAFMETDSSGYYLISGIASGTYRSKTMNQQGYIDVWYPNGTSWDEATPFTIADNDTLTGINFNLAYGGFIEGHIQNNLSEPISGIYINVYDTMQNFSNSSVSDDSGNFIVGGLYTGAYKLHSDNYSGYINKWYNNKFSFDSADIINVSQGDTTRGILFQLEAGGLIKGYVKSDSGIPISGVTVLLYDLGHSLYEDVQTDSNGFYSISSIEPGNYKLCTHNTFGYIDKYYDNKSSFESADTLILNGDTLDNINFNLIYTGIPFDSRTNVKSIKVFFSNEKLIISGLPDGVKQASLFDISGVNLIKRTFTENSILIKFYSIRNGVYFLKLEASGGRKLYKKIICIK